MTDQEQIQQAIHRASFGYRLTSADAVALLRYAQRQVARASVAEARALAAEAEANGLRAQNAMQLSWSDRAS